MPAPILKSPFVPRNAALLYGYDTANDQWVANGTTAAGASQVTSSGSGSTGTDRSGTVAITTGLLMAANANRTRLIVKNDGANAVWINLGGAAVATAGGGNYKIAAAGGFFELEGYTGLVNAIAETAPVAVSAREL